MTSFRKDFEPLISVIFFNYYFSATLFPSNVLFFYFSYCVLC